MTIQFWQVASGLGVGAFIAALFYAVIKQFGRREGEGFQTERLSARATAIIAILIIIIFGGITVLALVIYAPKSTAAESTEELKRLLGDRYAEMRKILDTEADHTPDKQAFAQLRTKIEAYLKTLEDALSHNDMTRVYETTKNLLILINSEETRKLVQPATVPTMLRYFGREA